VLIVDTAGRLHTKTPLMDELGKVKRVIQKAGAEVGETLLVLDGTTGQNGIAQARAFTDSVGVTGVVLTKMDGSAKGGFVLAVREELGVPVRLVGTGEGVADLMPFEAEGFADRLLGSNA
jgi:fused signal recognition particle receptor